MNLDKYEKIDGREALRRLADGEKIYDYSESYWFISEEEEEVMFYATRTRETRKAGCELYYFVSDSELYIKKTFDVRQAMLERPNEWVGAFKDRKGEWHKVGFDTESFMAIETSYDSTVKCEFYAYNVRQATEEEMYACIPIEDVPEEANQ